MKARTYRHLDPRIGRFISEDPIGFNGGDSNLYRYVGNNPIRLKDPFGFFSQEEEFAVWREISKWLYLANNEIKRKGADGLINPYELAWSMAKDSRDHDKQCNPDTIAAAEHYLYSRQWVETSSVKFAFRSGAYWAALGYNLKKSYFGQNPGETKPSDLQLYFGQLGAIDGD